MKTKSLLQPDLPLRLVAWLIYNKKRIAKILFLAGALVENLPDVNQSGSSELKQITGRVISKRKSNNGRKHRQSGIGPTHQ